MARLSDKYIAGFLDSDGHAGIAYRYAGTKSERAEKDSSKMYAHAVIEFSQLTRRDEVLYRIQEVIGGKISFNDKRGASSLKLFGKKAEMVLSRIRKHLVIKRHHVSVVLDMAGNIVDRKEATAFLKEERKRKSLPIPNFPTRKWMAGYLDGDGCFEVRVPKGRGSAQIALSIASSSYDSEGIDLIQKAFGGSISTARQGISSLTITMPPSKAMQMLGHCGKYLTIKKPQADFILGCAKMGNYRDGMPIKAALKQLKSQPHRLSEPRSSVKNLLEDVDGTVITPAESGREAWANGGCGCKASHYSGGVCRRCYDKQRWTMRQSELT